MIIVRNVDSIEHRWGGIVIPAGSQYTLQEVDRIRFLSDDHFITSLSSSLAVVNNGSNDMNAEQGLLLLQKQLRIVHEALQFSPAVGVNAPAVVSVTPTSAAHGHMFAVGDEVFALTHFDNIILNNVELQLHVAIDNSTADRWIEFEFDLLSTTGILDRAISGVDVTVSTGPVQVPTTPWLIFEMKVSLPQSLFDDERDNLFIRLRRKAPAGKIAPTNHPVVVRMDKTHLQKLDV